MNDINDKNWIARSEIKTVRTIEYVLAGVMIFVVIWGLTQLLISIPWSALAYDQSDLHKLIAQILSDILLLVVGMEFAILLIHRKIEYLIDVVLFVVARKMLIASHSSTEILLGVVAIAGLYAVRKYLLICPGCRLQPLDSNPDK